MSVKVCDRSLSKLEVVYNATVVKQHIHDLCIRSFCVTDYKQLVRKKYAMRADPDKNLSSYVLLMHQCKQRIVFLSDDLIASTRAANRFKLNTVHGCDKRLDYQERALADCEMLIGKIQDIADVFLVDLNRYRPCIESIDKEINLLKGWIRHTKRIRDKHTQGNV